MYFNLCKILIIDSNNTENDFICVPAAQKQS